MATKASSESCRARKGDTAELQAALWLMGKGYEVFRNVSCVGPADMVAWDPITGEIIFVDVKCQTKTYYTKQDGKPVIYIKKRKYDAVHNLYVIDGKVMGFLETADVGEVKEYWPIPAP